MDVVKVSPVGDLTLVVGLEKQHYSVTRATLEVASPVFRAMFDGRFVDASKSEIDLPEDGAFAMGVILDILHYRFTTIPTKVDMDQLLELCVLIDKYDFFKVVVPFWEDWVKNQSRHDLRYLSVAWTFGMREEFQVAVNGPYGLDGFIYRLKKSEIITLRATTIPSRLINGIIEEREAVITRLLSLCSELVEKSIQGKACKDCSHNVADRKRCNSLCLGSMIRELRGRKLWPIPKPSNMERSVQALRGALGLIKIDGLCETKQHIKDFDDSIWVARSFRQLKLNRTELRHLDTQKEKLKRGTAKQVPCHVYHSSSPHQKEVIG